MTSSGIEARRINVSSNTRFHLAPSKNPCNFQAVINHSQGTHDVVRVVVKSWQLTHLFNNVDEYRNTIYFDYTDAFAVITTVSVSIPPAMYTAATFVTALQNALNDPTQQIQPLLRAPATVTQTSGYATITLPTNPGTQFNLLSLQEIHMAEDSSTIPSGLTQKVQRPSMNFVVGANVYRSDMDSNTVHDVSAPAAPFDQFTMTNPLNLIGNLSVFLSLDNIAGSYTIAGDGEVYGIIDEMPLTGTPWGYSVYKEIPDSQNATINLHRQNMRRIHVTVRDVWGNVLTLPENIEVTVNLKVYHNN
jgi:hypothetical protein